MESGRRQKDVIYRIEQLDSRCRKSFDNYEFRIYADDRPIALFWHDYRGDDQGIEFLSRTEKSDWPFSAVSEFVTGGGQEPLSLSKLAIDYLARHCNA